MVTSDGPLVSVLTPSFNQARWLEENLRSVEVQSYPRIEHIVMDGGSTDGSVEILKRHARPQLKWQSERDQGQSQALNKAFAASQGEILGWLNSDDAYCDGEAIALSVEAFGREPDLDVVYGHSMLVNADGLIIQTLWVPPFSGRLLRLHDFIVQPAAFIRRSALEGQFADEIFDYTMDYELWLRLARKHRFGRVGKMLAIDRHHAGRKSYLLADVRPADTARLHAMYGANVGRSAAVARKLLKVTQRFIGATLIPAAVHARPGFAYRTDGPIRLLRRQIATRRASMPVDRADVTEAGG